MLELYNHGKAFFELLTDAGVMLVDTKLIDIILWIDYNMPLPDVFDPFWDSFSLLFGDWSVAYFVIGQGLIFIIVFKLVKFFTDIIL